MSRKLKIVLLSAGLAAVGTVALAQSFTTFINARVTNQLDLQGTLSANGDTGSAGQVFTSNGSGDVTWEDAADTSPGGSDGQVQYNDAGVFAGHSGLTYNDATSTLTATNLSGDGSAVTNVDADLLDGINSTGFCQTGGTGCPDPTIAVVCTQSLTGGTINDYDILSGCPARTEIVRLDTSTTNTTLNGAVLPSNKRVIAIVVGATFNVTFNPENAGSSATNRFLIPFGLPCALNPRYAAVLWKDSVSDRVRWIPFDPAIGTCGS